VNFPAAEEIECRCAVCGKFKDYYSYAKTPEPELDAKVRLNRVLKIICVLSFIAFFVTLTIHSLWGVKHELAALVTLIVSATMCFGGAVMVDEKADEEWKKKGAQHGDT
jgi:hypothetical protein